MRPHTKQEQAFLDKHAQVTPETWPARGFQGQGDFFRGRLPASDKGSRVSFSSPRAIYAFLLNLETR